MKCTVFKKIIELIIFDLTFFPATDFILNICNVSFSSHFVKIFFYNPQEISTPFLYILTQI